jgi:hypothetical protein
MFDTSAYMNATAPQSQTAYTPVPNMLAVKDGKYQMDDKKMEAYQNQQFQASLATSQQGQNTAQSTTAVGAYPGVSSNIQALVNAGSPNANVDPVGSTQQLGLGGGIPNQQGAQQLGSMNAAGMNLGGMMSGLGAGQGTPTNIVNLVTSTLLSSYAQDPVNGKKLIENIMNDPGFVNNPNFQAAYQQIQALEAAHMQGGAAAPQAQTPQNAEAPQEA